MWAYEELNRGKFVDLLAFTLNVQSRVPGLTNSAYAYGFLQCTAWAFEYTDFTTSIVSVTSSRYGKGNYYGWPYKISGKFA